jgi:hypothetical protein
MAVKYVYLPFHDPKRYFKTANIPSGNPAFHPREFKNI